MVRGDQQNRPFPNQKRNKRVGPVDDQMLAPILRADDPWQQDHLHQKQAKVVVNATNMGFKSLALFGICLGVSIKFGKREGEIFGGDLAMALVDQMHNKAKGPGKGIGPVVRDRLDHGNKGADRNINQIICKRLRGLGHGLCPDLGSPNQSRSGTSKAREMNRIWGKSG